MSSWLFEMRIMKSSWSLSMDLALPNFRPSSPRSLSFFSYLTIFPSHPGQPNTFIIFCSTNKAVHWREVLTPHNDPLSESHCSYTQDNYSTLHLERGNYWERCSSRVMREEKRGLGQGSCGCIVYLGGRGSNKGPQLKQDAGRKTWCGHTNAEKKLGWPWSLSKTSHLRFCCHCTWHFLGFGTKSGACVSFCPVSCQVIQAILQSNKNTWAGWTPYSALKGKIASGKTKWRVQKMCSAL